MMKTISLLMGGLQPAFGRALCPAGLENAQTRELKPS